MSAVIHPLPRAPDELDELTLARARRGDESACRELVTRYQRPVFALLSRLLARSGRTALVEDLAQETFLRAFRALPDFDTTGPARLSTWLLTIATRLAIDELKSRRPIFEPLRSADAVPSPARTDQVVEQRRIGNRIAIAVDALTTDQRAAFLLYEAHGLSYEEVARALDIDLGTLKSRLSRARAALRLALEERT
jgi:RNA polymerase sigma-70 factor (ECF subfamily)